MITQISGLRRGVPTPKRPEMVAPQRHSLSPLFALGSEEIVQAAQLLSEAKARKSVEQDCISISHLHEKVRKDSIRQCSINHLAAPFYCYVISS